MRECQSDRLKRLHIFLMKHPKTALFSGILIMGKSTVSKNVPTARTNGLDVEYGEDFISRLTDPLLCGVIMHETGHKFLRHMFHYKPLFKEDPQLANEAADYVVNDLIVRWNTPDIKIGDDWLWDEKFRDWDMPKIFDYLKRNKNQRRSKNGPDEHDLSGGYDEKSVGEQIDKALRQGGILSGILGHDKDRVVDQFLTPKIDWREVLRNFINAFCVGKEEYSWRRFNRRLLPNDIYMPSPISEKINEIVVAIDTSGSIGATQLSVFVSELVSICESVEPERLRVLWWDSKVHGEQVFDPGTYSNLHHTLKPVGGGGTRVSSVSEYLITKNYKVDCVVIFTDGYVESDVVWNHTAPLLWVITDRKNFTVPIGQGVNYES